MWRALVFLGAFLLAGAAAAQQTEILVVDRERVLSQSAPALALRKQEQERRAALRKEFERLKVELETEEAAIAEIRDRVSKEEFETRVRAFDRKVREVRRDSQRASEALQGEFTVARRRLADALEPILRAVMEERGATLILDARLTLVARETVDVTEEVLRRFAEVEIDFGLSPPAAGDGG